MRLIRTIDRWLRDWTAAWNAVVGDELRKGEPCSDFDPDFPAMPTARAAALRAEPVPVSGKADIAIAREEA